MRTVPIVMNWREVDVIDADGVATRTKAMVPNVRYAKVAAKQFADGEEYPLVVLEARSRASHNQFFAALQDGFDNLPESIAARWPTVEHFRKWALIECGWFDEKEIDFGSALYAKRAAILLHDEFDEYARIFQPNDGPKLIVRRAKSQSASAMSKEPFEKSKRDVLDLVESMIGVERGDLKKQARSA